MKNSIRSSLMILTFCSFATITSCNKRIDYKINLDDMEKIISLIDVKYAQAKVEITGSGGGVQNGKEQMSPTAYYEVATGDIENFEKYVYYDKGNKLMKVSRYKGSSWSEPEEAFENELITPEKRGIGIKNHYTMAKIAGSTFVLDKNKLCYVASFSIHTMTENIEFYFRNNKLVKFIYSDYDEKTNEMSETQTMELEYKKITPDDPRS